MVVVVNRDGTRLSNPLTYLVLAVLVQAASGHWHTIPVVRMPPPPLSLALPLALLSPLPHSQAFPDLPPAPYHPFGLGPQPLPARSPLHPLQLIKVKHEVKDASVRWQGDGEAHGGQVFGGLPLILDGVLEVACSQLADEDVEEGPALQDRKGRRREVHRCELTDEVDVPVMSLVSECLTHELKLNYIRHWTSRTVRYVK